METAQPGDDIRSVADLKGAQNALERLDFELGPRLFHILRDAHHRAPVEASDIETIRQASEEAATLLVQVRNLIGGRQHLHVTTEHLTELLAIESELHRRVDELVAAAPETHRRLLWEAIEYLWHTQARIRLVFGKVGIEIVSRVCNRRGGWQTPLSLPAPGYSEPPKRFAPTELQQDILNALDGRSLTIDGLERRLHKDRRVIYERKGKSTGVGGLHELVRRGLVQNDPGYGYYRPDRPPPGMSHARQQ